jgi:hypothetical protein
LVSTKISCFQWTLSLRYGYEVSHLLGMHVWILPGGTDVSVVHSQIRGLCKGLNTSVKESCRAWCIYLSVITEPQQWGVLGPQGLSSHEKQSMKMKTGHIKKNVLIFFFLHGHASHALGNMICCFSAFAGSNLKACICLMNMHSACSFICSSLMFSIYLHFPWNNILCVCHIDILCIENWSLFLMRCRLVVSESDVDILGIQWIFIY